MNKIGSMEPNKSVILDESEFVEQFLNENDIETMDAEDFNLNSSVIEICVDEIVMQPQHSVDKVDVCPNKGSKSKRRANLTEFGDSLTTKRKNESMSSYIPLSSQVLLQIVSILIARKN